MKGEMFIGYRASEKEPYLLTRVKALTNEEIVKMADYQRFYLIQIGNAVTPQQFNGKIDPELSAMLRARGVNDELMPIVPTGPRLVD